MTKGLKLTTVWKGSLRFPCLKQQGKGHTRVLGTDETQEKSCTTSISFYLGSFIVSNIGVDPARSRGPDTRRNCIARVHNVLDPSKDIKKSYW